MGNHYTYEGYVLGCGESPPASGSYEFYVFGPTQRPNFPPSRLNCPECDSYQTYKTKINMHPPLQGIFCAKCGNIFDESVYV